MPSKNNKPVLQTTTVARKDFNYNIGDIRLNFQLRTDIKGELKAFREMLVRATEDVDKELETPRNEVA